MIQITIIAPLFALTTLTRYVSHRDRSWGVDHRCDTVRRVDCLNGGESAGPEVKEAVAGLSSPSRDLETI